MSDLKEVTDKLDTLIRLTALSLFNDGERTQREKIELLGSAGLSKREIADILGTTPNTVNVTLSRLSKKRKQKAPVKPTFGDAE